MKDKNSQQTHTFNRRLKAIKSIVQGGGLVVLTGSQIKIKSELAKALEKENKVIHHNEFTELDAKKIAKKFIKNNEGLVLVGGVTVESSIRAAISVYNEQQIDVSHYNLIHGEQHG